MVSVGLQKLMPETNKVGFVGLGAMGMGMATQLLKKGFQVAGVDARAEVKERFAAIVAAMDKAADR